MRGAWGVGGIVGVVVLCACGNGGPRDAVHVASTATSGDAASGDELYPPLPLGKAGWYRHPGSVWFPAAVRLADGTCLAGRDSYRWIVTPDASVDAVLAPTVCDGWGVLLPPHDHYLVQEIVRVGSDVFYKDGLRVWRAVGVDGKAELMVPPFEHVQDIGALPDALIVSSTEGELARWDGTWKSLSAGKGRVTKLAVVPGAIVVILDKGSVVVSSDRGEHWSKPELETSEPVALGVTGEGEVQVTGVVALGDDDDDKTWAQEPVPLGVPIKPPMSYTHTTVAVRYPAGVVGLSGHTLDEERALDERLAEGCSLEAKSVLGQHVAFLCREKSRVSIYRSDDYGKTSTKIGEVERVGEIAVAPDEVLVTTASMAARFSREGKKERKKWRVQPVELPSESRASSPLFDRRGRRGFFVLLDGAIAHVGDDGALRTQALPEAFPCTSALARAGAPWVVASAHVDALGDPRLIVSDGVCTAYVHLAPSGKQLSAHEIKVPVRASFPATEVSASGARVVAIFPARNHELHVSEDSGATFKGYNGPPWIEVGLDPDHRHVECTEVGCNFWKRGGVEAALWRWGTEPLSSNLTPAP